MSRKNRGSFVLDKPIDAPQQKTAHGIKDIPSIAERLMYPFFPTVFEKEDPFIRRAKYSDHWVEKRVVGKALVVEGCVGGEGVDIPRHSYDANHPFGFYNIANNPHPMLNHRIPAFSTTSGDIGSHYSHPRQPYQHGFNFRNNASENIGQVAGASSKPRWQGSGALMFG